MKDRVIDCISPLTADIDLEARYEAPELDKIVNRCISAVTESLKKPSGHFTDFQRGHLVQVFNLMRHGHRAIREMLRSDGQDPMAVNVMPLVRSQLEILYALCLIVEDSDALNLYLKDGWKKLYIRHILMREECRGLPRVVTGSRVTAADMEMFRVASGVTQNEKQTIDEEELGTPLPAGIVPEKIQQFPSPGKVLRRVRDTARKKMLQRLYPEYQFLCGFVHFSPAQAILSTLLDKRQLLSTLSTSEQKYEIFQKEIAGPAFGIDVISTVQSCCEFISIYPGDIELVRAACEAWKQLADFWLLGRVVWQLRAQKLLGALS